ncbi:hypothetical protein C5610_11510 [Idiomarina sp. OT37-5b]|jgi:hypothetical protein|uniref:Uncharacterized protein n=1 Tax=Idiomarina aquatica TaxID=1327752 RepID=A0AA94EF13_9GAMM|nr:MULTISPECIES: hypothetical protein [Idiomarina]AVJ56851.1 hypothetical protein C5610_11510 [Idiomarina sp. OT37-5b]RUO42412.1 hypothetical protein CWE23_09920 [Idiomarina aquatica]
MNKPSSNNKPSFEQWLTDAGEQYRSAENMPEWDREAIFRAHYRPTGKLSWWSQPMAFASFALSCLAVSLVVVQSYRADIDAQVDARVAEIVEQKLSVFEEQQKMRLAQQSKDLRNDFREQLSTSTTQLATYILATNRQERQADMENLVEYVNDTREEDITFYAQQLRRVGMQNHPPMLENE